jgi:hypothetical protein
LREAGHGLRLLSHTLHGARYDHETRVPIIATCTKGVTGIFVMETPGLCPGFREF